MKNKKSLVFGILISVIILFGLLTIFVPYVSITKKGIRESIKVVFQDAESMFGITGEGQEDNWEETLTGINLVKKLNNLKLGQDMTYVKQIKSFVVGGLYVAWGLGLTALVLSIVLKGKRKYIVTLALSILSVGSMVFVNLRLPNVVKEAVVVGVEAEEAATDGELNDSQSSNTDEALDIITGESLRDVVTSWVGQLARELLDRSVAFGYWLWIIFMGIGAVLSSLGLWLDKGTSKAFITVLSGDYKGASIEVDSGIMVGRDPKLCQLVMDERQISRKHCRINYNYNTGRYLVTDHSSNGTYYDEERKLDENVATELKAGTVIMLGKNGVRLKLG